MDLEQHTTAPSCVSCLFLWQFVHLYFLSHNCICPVTITRSRRRLHSHQPGSPSRPGGPGGPRVPVRPWGPGGPRSPFIIMGPGGTAGSPGGPRGQMLQWKLNGFKFTNQWNSRINFNHVFCGYGNCESKWCHPPAIPGSPRSPGRPAPPGSPDSPFGPGKNTNKTNA